mmetsp:Transcript_5668/g.6511  ORF Transcript_5668/g.6511 Transcript_5668/m.6511 type:complete len:205 (-) Transcript_5668:505-1119(-)
MLVKLNTMSTLLMRSGKDQSVRAVSSLRSVLPAPSVPAQPTLCWMPVDLDTQESAGLFQAQMRLRLRLATSLRLLRLISMRLSTTISNTSLLPPQALPQVRGSATLGILCPLQPPHRPMQRMMLLHHSIPVLCPPPLLQLFHQPSLPLKHQLPLLQHGHPLRRPLRRRRRMTMMVMLQKQHRLLPLLWWSLFWSWDVLVWVSTT